MDWHQNTLNILGLTDFEKRIVQSLDTAKSLSEISGETKIIRTSVAYNLKVLIQRGLVYKIKYKKRYRYIALSPDQLSVALGEIITEATKSKRVGVRIKTTEEDEFIVHVGSQEIIPAFKRIAEKNKNTRIKAIQHHKSFTDQVTTATATEIKSFNSTIIKNNIIIEGILNESAYETYLDEIKSDPKNTREAIETLGGRMADYYIFPDNRFDCHSEIWIFKATTLIINWKKQVAIEIINTDMAQLTGDMYEYVKGGCRKIDHNEMMRQLIKKVSEDVTDSRS